MGGFSSVPGVRLPMVGMVAALERRRLKSKAPGLRFECCLLARSGPIGR